MSSISVRIGFTLSIGLLLLAGACTDARKSSAIFDSKTGKHPDSWVADHPASFISDTGQCTSCHGSDLMGGISKVSCYSASFNGMSCHVNGPSGHPAGWSDPGSHGASTKAAPDANLGHGFQYCERCHGADFAGGSVNKSCFTCHGVSAPHSPAPWRGGVRTHTNTDPGNAAVCAQCHLNGLNSTVQPNPPAPAGTAPGCFNSTLCHGQVGHAVGWSSPDVHGASAKSAPGTSSGFAYCQSCHGTAFNGVGGIATTSCLNTAGCHGATAASPHSPTPWRSGGTTTRTHATTNTANASVCDQCHHLGNNSTRQPVPPYGTTAGCFNNSLCHGIETAPHAVPFTASTDHGPAAKTDLTYCEGCHATPSNGLPGDNPRFNVPIGSLGSGCEGGSCHITNTAHPKPWSSNNTHSTSHQTAGNMANACALCHGVTLGGGNGPACSICHTAGSPLTLTNCTSCHASPPSGTSAPNRAGSHAKHYVITTACGSCHSNAGSGTALHYNATVNVAISPTYNGTVPATFNASAKTCSNVSCHTDAYSSGSATTPPWGTASGCGTCHGNSASGAPSTGSHSSHTGIGTCGSCHAGAVSGSSGGSAHIDGNIDVIGGYPANVTKHAAGSGYSTCSSASCHVSAYSASSFITPTWGTAAVGCGSCHPVAADGAPATGSHAAHLTAGAVCADCHNGAVKDVNGGAQHTDGNIDVYKTTPGDLGYPQNVAKHTAGSGYSSCSTASCHGTATWGVVGAITCVTCHASLQTGTHGTPRDAVVGEFGLAWGHKKSGRGAVTSADCIVCHLEGNYATQARSAYHGDGNIDLRDPDGAGETPITNISGGPFTFTKFATSYAAGSRTSTGHTANTIDNVLTQKFCLACHDNNGATNTTARTAGGTTFMPWGGVNLGPNYTVANGAAAAGGVVDVKTQFATTNASVHPVRGPITKDFPYSTRLAVPYNNIGTARDSNSPTVHVTTNSVVINCFDCHNTPTTPLTTRTVAAHGNATSLRGVNRTTGTPSSTNAVTLCIVCHAGYNTSTSSHHGTGSALASSTNGGMTTYLRYGCYYCHSSNAVDPGRPVRGVDAHGFNRLAGTGADALWPTGVTETNRPYGFIRATTTNILTNHRPFRSPENTTGSAQCTAVGSTSPCDDGMGTYTPGGSY